MFHFKKELFGWGLFFAKPPLVDLFHFFTAELQFPQNLWIENFLRQLLASYLHRHVKRFSTILENLQRSPDI
jgi:hypothetical protein